jgi:hypothetical protein
MLDSLFGTGKLEKMLIVALNVSTDKKTPPVPSKVPEDSYQVQINPESYTISQRINYEHKYPAGSPGDDPKFDHLNPTTLDFTIVFDGTGVVPPPAGPLDNVPIVGAIASLISGGDDTKDVVAQLRKFANVVYAFKEADHRPRRVRLTWGKQLFDGVLTSISLNYKLFSPAGVPLRVEAKVSFESVILDIMRDAELKKSSPDLTHNRTVIAGDTLPLLTHDIYGTPKYYVEVARANKLYNFRKLNEGKQVFFPPTKKTAS